MSQRESSGTANKYHDVMGIMTRVKNGEMKGASDDGDG